MKRTFAKRGFMSLVAGFFLFGFMLLSAVRAEAQTWVNSDEAKNRLVTAIAQQANIANSSQPGTPTHTDAMIHVYYYKGIYNLVNDGTPVSDAVTGGLGVFTGQVDPNLPFDKTNINAFDSLKDDATDLLTD